MLEVAFKLEARCRGCGLETTLDDLTGTIVARGESTYMVKVNEPCTCGADVVCVTFAVDIGKEAPPESR